jgi:hypothetical protein
VNTDRAEEFQPISSKEESRTPMSQVTELAVGQLNTLDTVTVELVEADGHPAVIIIKMAR